MLAGDGYRVIPGQSLSQLIIQDKRLLLADSDGDSLPEGWEVSWENLNDESCEGIRHTSLPAFSVQFHPESCPGPEDANVLFDEFVEVLKKYKK